MRKPASRSRGMCRAPRVGWVPATSLAFQDSTRRARRPPLVRSSHCSAASAGGADAAFAEALQEPAPVDFGFGAGNGDTGDDASAIAFADANGDEHGATAPRAPDPHFFISGVHEEVAHGIKGPGAPLLKEGIKLGRDAADFGGGDGGAAAFFQDGGDAAGGHTLEIHLGDGEGEGFFAALPFLKGLGVEGGGAVADLGDGKLHGAAAGEEGFGFEAVGEAEALPGALVGGGLKVLGALDFHGGVDKQANRTGESFEAVGEEMIEHGVGLGMGEVWFGHGGAGVR